MYSELSEDEKSGERSETLPLKMGIDVEFDKEKGNHLQGKILSNTKSVMNHVVVLGAIEYYMYSSEASIWLLYGRTFLDETETLAIIFYVGLIILGTLSLVVSPFSDIYGHNNVMILLYSLLPIGFALEAFSSSIYMLAAGFYLSRWPAYLINYSYIGWILPLHYSKQYMGTMYQFGVVSYILAPVVTGVIVSYFDYQCNFIVITCISILGALYTWVTLFKSQQQLEKQQMKMRPYYLYYGIHENGNGDKNKDQDKDKNKEEEEEGKEKEKEKEKNEVMYWQTDKNFRFPCVLESISNKTDIDVNKNSKIYLIFSKLTKYEWFCVINVLFQNGLMGAVEQTLISYYNLYMEDRFGIDIIFSTIQLGEMCLGLIIGTQLVKFIANKKAKMGDSVNTSTSDNNNNNDHMDTSYTFCNIYVLICLLMYVCGIGVSLCFYSGLIITVDNMNVWYGMAVLNGFILGCASMCSEVMLLDLQPKSIIGFITGLKGFIKTTTQAFGILVIGLYWNTSENYSSLWDGHAILYFISAILLSTMAITQHINLSRNTV